MHTIIDEVSAMFPDIYLVGGSVRDMQLGKQPKDYDFCTPYDPDQIENIVRAAGKKPHAIGKRFGTIGFKCAGEYVEVTTFRTELYERGNRKPTVWFVTDITQDLSRRDFTINAMAMRGTRIIDPFGGRLDILERKIKPVGDGGVRIREDPLRMLRAARFASQLDFTVDPKFIGTMRKHAQKIMTVSRERWCQEIDKLLMTDHPETGLQVLADSHVLKYIMPELWLQIGYDQNSPYHALTLWEHTKSTVAKSPRELDLRWSALLHDIGKPFVRTEKNEFQSNYIMHDIVGSYMAEGIAARLKWSGNRTKTVVSTIRDHLRDDSPIRAADNDSKSGVPMN